MHVLQLNDKLPDNRVEKTINSDLRLGNKVSFIGINIGDSKINDSIEIYRLNLSTKYAFFKLKKFQTELKILVDEIDPDVIHAHNILFGRAALDMGYPVLYNDHEFWSYLAKINNPIALPWTRLYLKKKVIWPYRYYIHSKYEKEILSECVSITPSENISLHHQKKGRKSFVMHNFPEREEVEDKWDLAISSDRIYDGVYLGHDMGRKSYPFRQAHQAFKILKSHFKLAVIGDLSLPSTKKITSFGVVKHDEIMGICAQAVTGLLPWKPHPHHINIDANKYYHYLHAGAIPIMPRNLSPIEDLSYRFDSISEISDLINKAKQNVNPETVISYAKENCLWNDEPLKLAYEAVLEN